MTDFLKESPVAAVTGGGSGIGRATARHLADNGYRVAVLDIDPDSGLKTTAGREKMVAFTVDVTDPEQVEETFRKVENWGGRLDALVNSAGGTRPLALVVDMELSDFRAIMELHLVGSFLCLRQAARLMAPRGFGRILLIGSMAGLFGLYGKAHYAAAKAGLRGLVATAAKELKSFGVTVNLLAPGLVLTPMAVRSGADKLPGGADPEQVAAVIRFLVSREAGHLNGVVLPLDGAENLMKGLDHLYAKRLE
jgi:3-oxoacyl-[acyl-carrier protein] reductase